VKTHLEPLIISTKGKSLIYASHIAWNVTDEAHAFRWSTANSTRTRTTWLYCCAGLRMRANFHSGNWEIDICRRRPLYLADGIRALKRPTN